MFRLVVAMYLMIATAVGPAACCCTLTRLTKRIMPATSLSVPPPGPCCHHVPPSKRSKGESNRPDVPGCPCKRVAGCGAVALPASLCEALGASTRAASGLPHFRLALLADRVALPSCSSSFFREGVGTAPSATTDDLLYAFHMLRC